VATSLHPTILTRRPLIHELKFVLDYEPWENIDDLNFCLKCLPESQSRHNFEHALCIALIFYIYNAFAKLPWTTAYMRLGDELTALVRGYTPEPAERNCMIWIRIAAMASWKGWASLTPEGLVQITKLVGEHVLHYSSWADLGDIFHPFLWNAQLGKDWESPWEEGKSANYADAAFATVDKQANPPL
jgi:hypothetical protein